MSVDIAKAKQAVRAVRQAATWHSGSREGFLNRAADELETALGLNDEQPAPVVSDGPPAAPEVAPTPTPEPDAPVAEDSEPPVPDVPAIPGNIAPAP